MEMQILRPQRNKIEVTGRISYQESRHAWSLLNLRKEIIAEFPQLKERLSSFGYKMAFFHESCDLDKFLRKIKREGTPIPILLWLVKEKRE